MNKSFSMPPVYCTKSGNNTYIRTYKNVRVKGKSYPVKTDVRIIGKINNKEGLGKVDFREDFIREHKELAHCVVVRVFDEKQGKYTFSFTDADDERNIEFKDYKKVISVKKIGLSHVVMHKLQSDPLFTCLRECFPTKFEKLLSLAIFCADGGDFRSEHYLSYAREHKLPCDEELTACKITRLFQSIEEQDVLNFFYAYTSSLYSRASLSRRRFWALDSTSISTYSRFLDAKFGHSKQGEDLPQINVVMLTDEKSHRPLFYEKFNGSIPDVSTVVSTFSTLLHLDTRAFVAVMDRGYYSRSNLKNITDAGFHFITCVPCRKVTEYDEIIMQAQRAFITGTCYEPSIEQNTYTSPYTIEFKENGKIKKQKVFVHVFYSQEKAGSYIEYILKRRASMISKLKKGEELDGSNIEFTREFLNKNEDGVYEINNAAFQEANNRAGVFVLVSDVIRDAKTAFKAYKDRESVEDCFKDLKVKMNCNSFYVSTEESLVGKCFIEFIALSIRMLLQDHIEKMKNAGRKVPYNSFRKIVDELQGITEITFSQGFIAVKPLSKIQQECLKLFKAKIPANRYDSNVTLANQKVTARKTHKLCSLCLRNCRYKNMQSLG